MGNFFTKLMNKLISKKEYRIIMVGLDGAGKTTILYKLKLGDVILTVPTIGFNVESVDYKNISFNCWDIGGQKKIRALWHHYYFNTDAIILVIDSSDLERIDESYYEEDNVKYELAQLMSNEELKNSILLVYANKQDLKESMSVDKIAEKIGLTKIINRPWHIQTSNAKTGDGIYDGLEWLTTTLPKYKEKIASKI